MYTAVLPALGRKIEQKEEKREILRKKRFFSFNLAYLMSLYL
jgi:hypothetical protein